VWHPGRDQFAGKISPAVFLSRCYSVDLVNVAVAVVVDKVVGYFDGSGICRGIEVIAVSLVGAIAIPVEILITATTTTATTTTAAAATTSKRKLFQEGNSQIQIVEIVVLLSLADLEFPDLILQNVEWVLAWFGLSGLTTQE
jgi:hypothetical protein